MNPLISKNTDKIMETADSRLRLAVIAGATHALKYLQRNRKASHDEAIGDVAKNTKEILEKIDEPTNN